MALTGQEVAVRGLTEAQALDKVLENSPPQTPTFTTQYLVAIVSMFSIGIASVVAILALKPAVDNTVLITMVLTFISTMLVSVLGLLKSQEGTHKLVNSEMVAFRTALRIVMTGKLDAARAQGSLAGVAAGVAEEQQRTTIAAQDKVTGAAVVVLAKLGTVPAPIPTEPLPSGEAAEEPPHGPA